MKTIVKFETFYGFVYLPPPVPALHISGASNLFSSPLADAVVLVGLYVPQLLLWFLAIFFFLAAIS